MGMLFDQVRMMQSAGDDVMADDIGERFWAETKHRRDRNAGRALDWDSKPETYKEYPIVPRTKLPPPGVSKGLSFEEVLLARRSGRSYSHEEIDLSELSYLLTYSTGMTRRDRGHEFRVVPSAGALYPIETYLCINRVKGVGPGIYHYGIRGHELERLREGEKGDHMAASALDQDMVADSAVTFVWTAMFPRQLWKYGQRTFRYVDLDAGHIGQNLALACAAQGFAACHIAAFYDDEVNALLGVDGIDESVVYMTAVGRPR
jgi:SagB-type dehydrogenase family enzyme